MLANNLLLLNSRVRGTHIFSIKTFLICLVITPIGMACFVPVIDITIQERGMWLLVGVISQAVLGIYMLFISQTLLKRVYRGRRTLSPILALLLLGGAIRGATTTLSADLFALEDDLSILIRMLNSSFIMLCLMGAFGFIFEGQERYIQEYKDLYRKFLLLKRERSLFITIKPAKRLSEVSSYIEKVTATLRGHLADLDESEVSEREAIAVAEEIKEIIEQKIRPLSHRLWLDRSNNVPRFRITRLAFDAIFARRISYKWISSALLVVLTLQIIVAQNILVAALSAIPAVAIFFMIFLIEDLLRERHLVLGNWLHPAILLLITFIPSAVTVKGIERFGSGLPNAYIFILLSLVNLFFVVIFTMVTQIFTSRAKILELLDKSVTDDLLAEHLHTLASMNQDSEIATYLHGSLQSELTAIALQLQQASVTGDSMGVRKMLRMAQIVINRDLSEDFTAHEISPMARLKDFALAWAGIATIKVELANIEEYQPDFINDVAQLVEEAISSSVRFGMAKKVEVTGAIEGNYYHLAITDNGRRQGLNNQGLGSAILDEIAPELWKRKFMDHGTMLDIHIPARQIGRV